MEGDGSASSGSQQLHVTRKWASEALAPNEQAVRHQVAASTRKSSPTNPRIRIAMLNVRCRRGDRLVSALRAMEQLNMDIVLLTETKLADERYTRYSYRDDVVATKATSHHQGGVALCWRRSEVCQVEGVCRHGPNLVSCKLVTGSNCWLVIGAYIPPSEVDGTTCNHIFAVQLLGDLNVDLHQPEVGSHRDAGIAAAVVLLGVEDMSRHFQQMHHHRDGYSWGHGSRWGNDT
jgi:hypothetical protein